MSALLGSALLHATEGRLVLPCEPRGKRPLTTHGLKDATTDAAMIIGWWRRWPDANVAIRTGRESRLVVLDVDGEAGAESLRELEHAHGPLPETTIITTPRGGRHYYFLHPGAEVRNSAGKVGASLDIRGDGGYVLVEPSVGANGANYERLNDAAPAAMPGWLAQPPTAPMGTQAQAAHDWLTLVRDGVGEGKRNDQLTRFVGHLLRRNLDVDLSAELAHLLNQNRCRPPLPDDEVDRIVDSICASELARRQGVRA